MSKKRSTSNESTIRGFRAANPELFNSPPGSAWESRGLLNKRPDPNDSLRFIYEFGLPERLPQNWAVQVPPISFGDNAPMPRWRLALDELSDPTKGRDLEKDLISTGKKTTIIQGLAPDSHPRSFDSSIGLGGLQWIFEPGLPGSLLSGTLLYEIAYMCLIRALNNQISRIQIRREIVTGPLWPNVCNVEDPLPPPPEEPETKYFEKYRGERDSSKDNPDIQTYKRPRSDVRARWWVPDSDEETHYADRIWYHEKGTQGPVHQTDPHEVLERSRKRAKKRARKEGKIEKIDRKSEKELQPKRQLRPRQSREENVATLDQKSTNQKTERKGSPGKRVSDRMTKISEEGPQISHDTGVNKTPSALKKHRRKRRTKKNVSFDDEAEEDDGIEIITRVSDMQMGKAKDLRPRKIEVSESDESDFVPEASVSKRFPTLAPGDVNMTLDDNNDYLNTFKEACRDPQDRKKYFPLPNAVRRIRPWAGANMPPEIEEKVRTCLPKFPSIYRPFISSRALANASKKKNAGNS